MEFGPRALGTPISVTPVHRSAVGDELESEISRIIPAFRAYRSAESECPIISISPLDSPYMLLVAPVKKSCEAACRRRDGPDLRKETAPPAGDHARGLFRANSDR